MTVKIDQQVEMMIHKMIDQVEMIDKTDTSSTSGDDKRNTSCFRHANANPNPIMIMIDD